MIEPATTPRVEYDIVPRGSFAAIDWRELWQFRELFVVLAWRDLAVRYKQTLLGVCWAVVRPLMATAVFTLIFNRLANLSSGDGTPYVVFVYVGVLFWQYFSDVVNASSASLLQNAAMIQKVYFPRLIVPAASALVGVADFVVGLFVYGLILIYYGYLPSVTGLALLPILFVALMMSSLGVGLFLAALNIKYRDVRHALPFAMEILKYLTPVIYPIALLDSRPALQTALLLLNPVAGIITSTRAALFTNAPVDWVAIAGVAGTSTLMLIVGLLYFRSTERYVADVI